ncbi:degT/DnrJ/EryC1/StrS aminotransferase [Paenibacillus sp. KACC 21273]|uniref:degT/DnrJ/EryC1/StrS aminotransferase n=1 Tax=Paenibacillus sp. KACC 21273 TaxID=3025665 RepID=UPI0023662066|nr:degT/DnrJ/EryC1/StrS aminotransferase [Paenibacillus sp. KACC 21273]WDF51257.1 degT/DnrJ/EryC1/StrS aminotransferase [Paenibacillus sp. KACC 21273]
MSLAKISEQAPQKVSQKDYFSISFVLARVLNTGIIMSIEKNEKELKGLESTLSKLSGKKYVTLYNSFTAAIHGALWGQDIVYGSQATLAHSAAPQERKFAQWLGIELIEGLDQAYTVIDIDWQNLKDIDTLLKQHSQDKAIVVNFTGLSFGPVATLLTNEEPLYKKSERLKIFGAFDLRTMWTQTEQEFEIQPGVQFNYRLSPLVGACVKLSLLRRDKQDED